MNTTERKAVDVLAVIKDAATWVGPAAAALRIAHDAVAELIECERWIPVTEALPDDPDEEVIVWRLYDKRTTGMDLEEWEADTSHWDGDEWLFGAQTETVQVSHWRRMPPGPDAALARVQGGQ